MGINKIIMKDRRVSYQESNNWGVLRGKKFLFYFFKGRKESTQNTVWEMNDWGVGIKY